MAAPSTGESIRLISLHYRFVYTRVHAQIPIGIDIRGPQMSLSRICRYGAKLKGTAKNHTPRNLWIFPEEIIVMTVAVHFRRAAIKNYAPAKKKICVCNCKNVFRSRVNKRTCNA